MKVGDLVGLKMKWTQPPQVPRHAIVLNTWRNHKGTLLEVEVMWPECTGIGKRFRADLFEVINESR
jgi:hypothetical protein